MAPWLGAWSKVDTYYYGDPIPSHRRVTPRRPRHHPLSSSGHRRERTRATVSAAGLPWGKATTDSPPCAWAWPLSDRCRPPLLRLAPLRVGLAVISSVRLDAPEITAPRARTKRANNWGRRWADEGSLTGANRSKNGADVGVFMPSPCSGEEIPLTWPRDHLKRHHLPLLTCIYPNRVVLLTRHGGAYTIGVHLTTDHESLRLRETRE